MIKLKNIFPKSKIFITIFVFALILANNALAGVSSEMKEQAKELAFGADMNTELRVGNVMQTVISAFLGMMGIVFLVLIVVAGYKYMMDQGEGKGVKEAMDSMKRAVIGLIIVVSAYAITSFVFKNLDAVNSGTTPATTSQQ